MNPGRGAAAGLRAADAEQWSARGILRIAALGSGSDYTAFLDHLGIASVNLGFGGEDRRRYLPLDLRRLLLVHAFFRHGFRLWTRAGANCRDGGDASGGRRTAAVRFRQLHGHYSALRYRSASGWPIRSATQIVTRNRQIDEGVFAAANDPRVRDHAAPPKETVPPFLSFAPLQNGAGGVGPYGAGVRPGARARIGKRRFGAGARAQLREANSRLIAVERALTLKEGLPNRAWFKNQIYAPGFYTGYGVKTLPAVRESIEQKQWKEADEAIAHIGKVLENAGEAIQGAAAELTRATK